MELKSSDFFIKKDCGIDHEFITDWCIDHEDHPFFAHNEDGVATPNQFHEKHTISFLNAKIPVLLEKPISSNIQKAKKIISSSRKNKTHLLIGAPSTTLDVLKYRANLVKTLEDPRWNFETFKKVLAKKPKGWLYKKKRYLL